MLNTVIVLGILAAAGTVVWLIYRRYGDEAPAGTKDAAGVPALKRLKLWLRVGKNTQPDPDDIPPAAARPLPPPPPAAERRPLGERGWETGGPPADGAGAPDGSARPAAMAQSDLLYAIGALVTMASTGDIRAVRRVLKTLSAASGALGGGISRLGTRLAEPDKHYDHTIWEPLVSAGAQMRAGALHCEQADAAMISLLGSTVRDLADSPRQAPHHSQLNGGS